jgi:hypothetical protein
MTVFFSEAELEQFRAAAEARMLSRATVRRKTGATTIGANGFEVAGWSIAYTDRPCRIAGMARSQSPSRKLNVGGAEVQVSTRVAHLPHGTVLRDGDLIEITTGELVGSVWRVVEADAADQQTARRVPVIATERPEEW